MSAPRDDLTTPSADPRPGGVPLRDERPDGPPERPRHDARAHDEGGEGFDWATGEALRHDARAHDEGAPGGAPAAEADPGARPGDARRGSRPEGPAAAPEAPPSPSGRRRRARARRGAPPTEAGEPSSARPDAGPARPVDAPASPVTVLLALHQGAAHLEAQLASLWAQEGGAPGLLVSDDGSTDDGPAIVRRHAGERRDVRLIDGPLRGAAANFLHLMRAVEPGTPFVALSDQDDVWLPDKTARALAALAAVPEGVPAVHCGRTSICDADGRVRRRSVLHARPPSFRNALVQSLAGGNTMTLNRAALDLVRAASVEAEGAGGIVVHDWWIYQIVSGAGGRMIYDPEPLLLYRQHGANAIGENTTAAALARRAAMVLGGRFRAWSEINLRALGASRHRLTPDARDALDAFAALRGAPPRRRPAAFRRAGLHRQTRVGDAALRMAALLGRL